MTSPPWRIAASSGAANGALSMEETVPSASRSRNRARSGLRIRSPATSQRPSRCTRRRLSGDRPTSSRIRPVRIPWAGSMTTPSAAYRRAGATRVASGSRANSSWAARIPASRPGTATEPMPDVEGLDRARVHDVHRQEVQVELLDRQPAARGVDEGVAHVDLAVGAAHHEEPAPAQRGHSLLGDRGGERGGQHRVHRVATGREHLGPRPRGRRAARRDGGRAGTAVRHCAADGIRNHMQKGSGPSLSPVTRSHAGGSPC